MSKPHPFERSRFLIVHGMDAKKWADRFNIEPFEHPCQDCGEMRRTTLPFTVGDFRGLIAEPCPCGCQHQPYGFVAAKGETLSVMLENERARAAARRAKR